MVFHSLSVIRSVTQALCKKFFFGRLRELKILLSFKLHLPMVKYKICYCKKVLINQFTSLTTGNKEEISRAIVDYQLMAKVKCIMDRFMEGLKEFGLLTKIME